MPQAPVRRGLAQEQEDAQSQAKSGFLQGTGFKIFVIIAIIAGIGLGYVFAATNVGDSIKGYFAKPDVSKVGVVITLDPFIVNVADTYGERYLKATLSLELTNPKAQNDVTMLTVPMRDAIINILSSKTLADLDDPQSKAKLKQEIKDRLNDVIGSPLVAQIYFQDFVMQ